MAMASPLDIHMTDGRLLRVHDAGVPQRDGGLVLVWHHGSPQTGALLEPLVDAAEARGIRVVSYGRPSYGGSSPRPGRTVADAADDVRQIADALGIGRFAVAGASGGGPHALACAALLPDRVVGAATFACPAPYSDELDWFAGMAAPGGLRAARSGREARQRFAETDEFDPNQFVAADWAALEGRWRTLGQDAGQAEAAGPDGLIDDDVAFAGSWGFDPGAITAPVLLVQGGADRVIPESHARSLLAMVPTAELWLRPRDGHVSALNALPVVLDWLISLDER